MDTKVRTLEYTNPSINYNIKNSTRSSLNNEIPCSEEQVLIALRKVLKLPTIIIQVGGYFPYTLTFRNELKIYPPLVIVITLQLLLHLSAVTLFSIFQSDFVEVFGQLTKTEMVTSTSFCCLGLLGQVATRVAIFRNHDKYVLYQSQLNKLFCDLVLNGQSTPASNLYLKWIKDVAKRTKLVGLIVCGTIPANMFLFFVPTLIYFPSTTLSTFHRAIFGLITVDFAVGLFLFNGLAIWLGSYIVLMQTAFKIIKHRAENLVSEENPFNDQSTGLSGFQWLLDKENQLETLVDQFNGFSVTYFLTWFIFIGTMMVNQLFQNLLWIRHRLYQSIVASAPTLVSGGITMFFVCTVAAELISLGRESVESLCHRCVEEYYKIQEMEKMTSKKSCRSSGFMKRVCFLHAKWQARPRRISPGGYFVLDRHLLTSVVGVMTTYIVVLLQFTDDTRENWFKIGNLEGSLQAPINVSIDIDANSTLLDA